MSDPCGTDIVNTNGVWKADHLLEPMQWLRPSGHSELACGLNLRTCGSTGAQPEDSVCLLKIMFVFCESTEMKSLSFFSFY